MPRSDSTALSARRSVALAPAGGRAGRWRRPRFDECSRQRRDAALRSGGGPRADPRRRVLVVDDEPAMRMLCRINLSASGLEVLEAADGEEALRLAAAEPPDLVLLDVMMPGLSGWDVAAALAADPQTRDVPVVFLTARADPADRARGRELGAVGYVTKPFDPIAIAGRIERTLERIARGERDQLRAEVMDGR
jgi:putative two-component system response regulator